jgi:hypothetical protein
VQGKVGKQIFKESGEGGVKSSCFEVTGIVGLGDQSSQVVTRKICGVAGGEEKKK